MGHFEDSNLVTDLAKLNKTVGINEGFFLGIKLLSEGKATANAIKVAIEVAKSGGGVANEVYIPLVGPVTAKDREVLQANPDPNSITAVGNYATLYSGLGNPTYATDYLANYSGTKDKNLGLGTLIQAKITEGADQKLSLFDLKFANDSGAAVYSADIVYDYTTMTRYNVDAKENQLCSEHYNGDGTSQLTNFANAGLNGYAFVINASVTSLINGSETDKTASITGSQWGINSAVSLAVTNFGSISGGSSGTGIALNAGGSVTNGSTADLTATITGLTAISFGSKNASQVSNFGIITGNTGISTLAPGPLTITNGSETYRTASIKGNGAGCNGVSAGGSTTVINFGSIYGSNDGLGLTGGDNNSVTNGSNADVDASISGGIGILAVGANNVVNNFGTISASYSDGIRLSQGGTINNGSAADTKASITGAGWGVNCYSGTLTNYGTISGGSGGVLISSGTVKNFSKISSSKGASGTAISYQPGGTNRLVEGPGSVIVGAVYGYGTLTVELASGASAGTIGGLGTNINGASTIAVDSGAIWTFSGANSIASFVNNGTAIVASGGSLNVSSAVDPSSSGVFQLVTNASLEIAAALGTNVKMQFLGSSPTNKLIIDKAANFGTNVGTASYAGPLLENFAAGDVIDLKGISPASLGLNYTAATGVLKITGSGGSALATLLFQNSTLGAGTFHAASDGSGGSGGTLITRS